MITIVTYIYDNYLYNMICTYMYWREHIIYIIYTILVDVVVRCIYSTVLFPLAELAGFWILANCHLFLLYHPLKFAAFLLSGLIHADTCALNEQASKKGRLTLQLASATWRRR